ncbi:MAG: TIGR04348 family glycosyltransferase [Planctomycetales bacterium]
MASIRILIVTPAAVGSRSGNRATARRWSRLLRSLGHKVCVAETYTGQPCDLFIALHARKSSASIARHAQQHPDRPIVLALTGTDLYHDIHHAESAKRSLKLTTQLVLLQAHGRGEIPRQFHHKVTVIYQSASPPPKPARPLASVFEVCVSGHLRAVKDPFRAALAARRLPTKSRIQITHVGAALSAAMSRRAQLEMDRNRRYRWFGEQPAWRARQLLARSRLLVLSSKMEGGANVISEAMVSSVPILATRISGSIGLLGKRYPGYFDVGDTVGLANLLQRCEQQPGFYRHLISHCQRQAERFEPGRESASWQSLLDKII